MRANGTESLLRRSAWTARLAWRAPLEARFPFRSPQAIERAQRRRIAATVAHAHRHVPYYRETMRRLGLGPGDIATAADLARLPLIEREQLQRDPEYFASDAWPLDSYLQLRSGGSTGEPITIFRHPRALFDSAAYKERWRSISMRLAGRRVRMRQALIVLPGAGGAAASFDSNTLLPSAVRVQRLRLSLLEPPAKLIGPLNEFRPDSIAGYGSYLEALFAYVAASGVEFHLPKTVGYSSDSLSVAARRLITERFGVHVLSAYRAIEATHIGFECERNTGYHLSTDLVPLRIVDPEGRELPAGERGEVVVSNVAGGHGTVVLNYRLGDVAARLPGGCECGRNLPLLSLLEGRSTEWIVDPRGERVHGQGVRDLMRLREEILGYQVVQETPTSFGAALVAPGADRDELAAWLEQKMRGWLGDEVEVATTLVEELPRTAGGKVRPVVSVPAEAGSLAGEPV